MKATRIPQPQLADRLVSSPDYLGYDADAFDVRAFNAALREAWEANQPVTEDAAERLETAVLEGRHGNWVGAANKARGGGR